jgi:putative holliday junction resolvase
MMDERLSSIEASEHLSNAGVKAREQKAIIDAVAAQVILQSYFDSSQTK